MWSLHFLHCGFRKVVLIMRNNALRFAWSCCNVLKRSCLVFLLSPAHVLMMYSAMSSYTCPQNRAIQGREVTWAWYLLFWHYGVVKSEHGDGPLMVALENEAAWKKYCWHQTAKFSEIKEKLQGWEEKKSCGMGGQNFS